MAKRSGQKLNEKHMLKLGIALQVDGDELVAKQTAKEIIKVLMEAGYTHLFYDEAAVAISGELTDVTGGMVPHCSAVVG